MYIYHTNVFTRMFSIITVSLVCTLLFGFSFNHAAGSSINGPSKANSMQGGTLNSNTTTAVVGLFTYQVCVQPALPLNINDTLLLNQCQATFN